MYQLYTSLAAACYGYRNGLPYIHVILSPCDYAQSLPRDAVGGISSAQRGRGLILYKETLA